MDDLCPSDPRNSAVSRDFQSERVASGGTDTLVDGHGICRVDDAAGPLYKAAVGGGPSAATVLSAARHQCDRFARTNGNFQEQSFD
jgi:hypothetical protein